MKIDFEFIKWVATQSEQVATNVAPLVAQVLNLDKELVLKFIKYVSDATDATIAAIEVFINFPTVFGAPGPTLTDASGCSLPDCACPDEFQPVVLALKAQTL
jgi:hypothetical protein